ncbi:lipocalin family protein [Haloferula sp.]|uniref:lipocalin family protein n=1 Tax=Haloferula sp. TaxID=2497595 RepID=UPI00329D287E
MMKIIGALSGWVSLLICSCTSLPSDVEPVSNFDLNGYLGTWYEIARTDHRFERGLEQVSAEYSLRDDEGVRVVNRGFSTETQEWKEIEGKAYPVGDGSRGHLKVSFFGPFYSAYGILELDPEGQFAFVSGSSRSYLWLLSRSRSVDQHVIDRFEKRATELGFDTGSLIYVKHDE